MRTRNVEEEEEEEGNEDDEAGHGVEAVEEPAWFGNSLRNLIEVTSASLLFREYIWNLPKVEITQEHRLVSCQTLTPLDCLPVLIGGSLVSLEVCSREGLFNRGWSSSSPR